MEELLKQMADLIHTAEEANIVPKGCNFYLTPEGCRIENEDDEVIFANN